jgi:RNA polymerase sigma-70 factor (ECF subfamily)
VSAFDGAEPVEELAEQHLASDMVRKAMQRLPESQKKVILLRYMEEYDTDEVAKIMGRGPMAIRALQHRALHSLWRILRREAGRDWHPAGQHQVASVRVAEGY